MAIRSYYILTLLILCTSLLSAQAEPEDEFGAWYILATKNKLSDKVTFNLQSQFRFYELTQEIEQFKVRTSVNYKFSNKVSASLGYAYFRTDPSYLLDNPESFNEHRIVEDLNFKDKLGKVGVLHRYRMEQRFFDFEDGSDTQMWIRYMLKLSYPVSKKVSLDIYDEIFINVEEPLFGQNWLGGGVSYKITNYLTTRVGYQKIHLTGRSLDRLIIGLTLSTDFRAKE